MARCLYLGGLLLASLNSFAQSAGALQSITIAPANPSLAKGGTVQFTATGNYSDFTTFDLTALQRGCRPRTRLAKSQALVWPPRWEAGPATSMRAWAELPRPRC